MNNSDDTDQLTFWSAEHLASHSASPDSAKDWLTPVGTWPSSIWGWLTAFGPAGWYGRMSPVSCHRTEDGTLAPSSGRWQNSGTGSPTECWTHSMSEWNHTLVPCRSGDAVCSLSDILETSDMPQRYYLSAKACAGILRRAASRGKMLPPLLQHALQAVATRGPTKTAEDM